MIDFDMWEKMNKTDAVFALKNLIILTGATITGQNPSHVSNPRPKEIPLSN